MGGSDTTTTNSQTTVMPQMQDANVQAFLGEALQLFRGGGPQFFPGQTVAQVTPDEELGRQMLRQFALDPGNGLNQATESNNFWLDPANLDPTQFAGRNASVDDLTQRLNQNFSEVVRPEIGGAAVNAQGVGGSRQGVLEGLGFGRTQQAIGSGTAQLDLGIGQQLLNRNAQAVGAAPGLFSAGMMPGGILQGVGQAERADEQANINAERERFQFNEMKPFNIVDWLRNVSGTSGMYGGTTFGEQTTEAPGMTSNQALSLGLLAASIFFPPAAAAAGATAGAGAGAGGGGAAAAYGFSDIRLKSDIQKIGRFKDYNLYSYQLFGKPEIGVMAHEVQEINPEAVILHDSGYLMVNYGAL